MISICIPVYNFDINPLIKSLSTQIQHNNLLAEIIIIDDCSNENYQSINNDIATKENYIKLGENVGRSKIRNLFLKYARFDYLLFLDCDSLIINENFISNYIDILAQENHKVVCGGRVYPKCNQGRNKMLRWKYGIKKESQPAIIREQMPNKSFMTNNFLIHRSVFKIIKFDERIASYGHEDTLFGYLLKKAGIPIKHIENAILNGDLETNRDYLLKTQEGIKNLVKIVQFVNYDSDFIKDVSLLNFYRKVESTKLLKFVNIAYKLSRSLIIWLLLKGIVSIKLFDFYKLGYLINNYK